ncbi:TlpA family protein disulfide reductase [Pleomorphochaeta sp. DL1XJH-081]|jgi:thiol-disulfide isomerase/thioredoxin|uniref:TlpA family protein disulfide reductase n=1 Tax=Pleomorphochaeta sp. DL1XJH-081 TaxID=3409690 RepID=UPI003BB4B809
MSYRKKQILTMAIVLMVITVSLFAAGTPEQGLQEFWTLDLKGEEISQEVFADNKLNMINVWATYCSPCLTEMPALAELHEEYADQGVNIIGLVTDISFTDQESFSKSIATAHQIVQMTGADYMHMIPSEDLYNLRLKDLQVVPETFFVDSKGNIVGETHYGARDKEAWKSIIESTLELLD